MIFSRPTLLLLTLPLCLFSHNGFANTARSFSPVFDWSPQTLAGKNCSASRPYSEGAKSLGVIVYDADKADLLITFDYPAFNVDQGIGAVNLSSGSYYSAPQALALSSRSLVLKLDDVSSLFNAMQSSSSLQVNVSGVDYVFANSDQQTLFNALGPCLQNEAFNRRYDVSTTAQNVRALKAPTLSPPPTNFTGAPSASAFASIPVNATQPPISAPQVLPQADVPKAPTFEKLSRFPQKVAAQNDVPTETAPLRSAINSQPPRSAQTPVTTYRASALNLARSSPSVIDLGQHCGVQVPESIEPLKPYIAGHTTQFEDRDLVESLQMKMQLLEREKEALKQRQHEVPDALSLVRVCTQEKADVQILARRVGEIEAQNFELSQQQSDPIEFDVMQGNIDDLTAENSEMQETLRELQARINELTVVNSSLKAAPAEVASPEPDLAQEILNSDDNINPENVNTGVDE